MISGAHVVVYSKNAEADRAFFRDILGFKSLPLRRIIATGKQRRSSHSCFPSPPAGSGLATSHLSDRSHAAAKQPVPTATPMAGKRNQ